MSRAKKDGTVTRKMNVTFNNEDEYNKFINGETHSDKGIRTNKGRLSSQPDIEVIDEDEKESDYILNQDYSMSSTEDGFVVELLKAIVSGLVEGLGEAITDIMADEEKRKILALKASNWWCGKALPGVAKTWNDVRNKVDTGKDIIRSSISGKTKAEQLLAEKKESIMASPPIVVEANEYFQDRETITMEEAQQQFDQIKVLAILLADKIKKLSNSCIRESEMTTKDHLIFKETIRELSSKEVLNSMRLLLENNSFMLDSSTSKIFSEFLKGNLIIEDRLVPIDCYSGIKKDLRSISLEAEEI